MLEKRIGRLEERTTREHSEFFERLRKLEEDRTAIKTHYEHINITLQALKNDMEEIKGAPAKRWDAILLAIIGVVVGFVLRSAGIF